VDNRYVSFYGNASYTLDNRLTVNGSIRIDQSNLFGTDPKYQYKPLWSVGAHYVLFQNKTNWLDRLVLRATYGINGNVSKKNGPYLIAAADRNNYFTNESAFYIKSPAVTISRFIRSLDFKYFIFVVSEYEVRSP